jgi:hypothetical protein
MNPSLAPPDLAVPLPKWSAWQSSTYEDHNAIASLAIDGNTNTNGAAGFCAITDNEDKPWLAIDMGDIPVGQLVRAVTLHNRADGTSGKCQYAKAVTDDPAGVAAIALQFCLQNWQVSNGYRLQMYGCAFSILHRR